MNKTTESQFDVIGIEMRTTNREGQSAIDIPALWNRFFTENIAEKIPGKMGNDVYCIYTDYEGDHTKPYTTLLGCKVASLAKIPAGLAGRTINAGTFVPYTATGDITKGIVFNKWLEIWSTPLERNYQDDYEVYGPKAQDPAHAEIDIFVGIKQ